MTSEFPSQIASNADAFPFYDVGMLQWSFKYQSDIYRTVLNVWDYSGPRRLPT